MSEFVDYAGKPLHEGFYMWKDGSGVLYVTETEKGFFLEDLEQGTRKKLTSIPYPESGEIFSREITLMSENKLEKILRTAEKIREKQKRLSLLQQNQSKVSYEKGTEEDEPIPLQDYEGYELS